MANDKVMREARDIAEKALGSLDVMPGLPDEVLDEIPQAVPKEYSRIKPAMGRIVLKEIPPADRTESGLHLVNIREQAGNVCTVVWICDPYESGSGDTDPSAFGPQYKPGDIVVIGKYNGIDVTLGRIKYILINESDVLGTLLESA